MGIVRLSNDFLNGAPFPPPWILTLKSKVLGTRETTYGACAAVTHTHTRTRIHTTLTHDGFNSASPKVTACSPGEHGKSMDLWDLPNAGPALQYTSIFAYRL